MAKQSENTEAQSASNTGDRTPAKTRAAGRSGQRASTRAQQASRRGRSGATLQKHLKSEHARLDALIEQYRGADPGGKEHALREAVQELIIQILVKEEVLYPALREAKVEDALINEAVVSYDVAKLILRDIIDGRPDDPFRPAKIALLAQTVEHHVAKEEQPRKGLLAQAAGIDDAAVVSRMQERRQALEAEGDPVPHLRPAVAFTSHPGAGQAGTGRPEFSRRRGEDDKMSQNGPDRDEHGRFMSHDDHRGGGGRGYGGGGASRGRMMEDDDRGRGMQSRGGRSQYDDDHRSGRGRSGGGDSGGRGRGDQSQGGWFGDSEGHSQASRQGWETRYREGNEHESGWHGDPQGHSQASRRGWETRYREGTEHDSGWHGDPEGHSEASRRGWETRRREGTEHESGWHGDPQGHSRASQMGWETRRREGNDHFDDERGARGRSGGGGPRSGNEGGYGGANRGYENEGRGDSRNMGGGRGYGGGGNYGRGRDQDHDREQGQGGWFGDSEGHSEASRRGWETRRHDDDDRGGRGRR